MGERKLVTPYATIFQSTLPVKKHSCATGGTPPLVMAAGGALSKSPRQCRGLELFEKIE
nr:MAG TPA: hypothetical protein [Caudoviricetes sp.]